MLFFFFSSEHLFFFANPLGRNETTRVPHLLIHVSSSKALFHFGVSLFLTHGQVGEVENPRVSTQVRYCDALKPSRRRKLSETSSGPVSPSYSLQHGCCWETFCLFLFCLLWLCGGNPTTLLLKITWLLPFQRQPSRATFRPIWFP